MITRPCHREAALLHALRAGSLDPDLRAHLETCTACQHTRQAATLLLQHAAGIHAAVEVAQLPSAAAIWHRARQQRQAIALRRASSAMLALRALVAVYLLALLAWFLRSLWIAPPTQARLAFAPLTTGAVPLGAAAAPLLLLAGASALLHLHRRQLPPLIR